MKVEIGIVVFLTLIVLEVEVVAIGLIGKMSQWAIVSLMASSIHSLMRMENGSKQNFS